MFSEPVTGDKFFGRQEVLDLFRKRVLALKDGYRQNMALTGQSLVGKSSIILHFLYLVREEGFIPVYVEVVKEPFRSFANKFIATLLYNALMKKSQHVTVDLDALMSLAKEHLPKTYQAARHISSLVDRQEIDEAYLGLLGLTSVVKDELGFSCIVILDEFDNLELLGIKNPFLAFGKVIMVQKETMYVVSSSRNRAIKKIISEKLSLLFGNFEVVRISNFEPVVARDFMETRLGGFDIEPGMMELFIHFTDGNPFYLDRISRRLKEAAIERMSSFIDRAIAVEAILDLVYDANGIIHQYLLNFIFNMLDTRSREEEVSVLIAMALGNNKMADIARSAKLKQTQTLKHLAVLLELGIVSRNGVFWRIDDAVLCFWLKNVYLRRKSMLVDGTFDRMSMFRDDIGVYIGEVMADLDKAPVRRIEELFNAFSNELIQVDHKQMRMPRFARVETKAFDGARKFVLASFRTSIWSARPYDRMVTENDIINYIRDVKSMEDPVANKIIIPLNGIDENSRLLAKELKMSIWEPSTVNTLLELYGKKRIIAL